MSTRKLSIKQFQRLILDWYKDNGRHNLPWRQTRDPYKIMVSEVMLQQTQVDRVILKYKEFLRVFPTIKKLASASIHDILLVWKGLGYNRRVLNLQKAAQKITTNFKGHFPQSVEDMETLPGFGHYTARAVAVFAFNQPHVFIETNIRRVFIHFFGDVIPAKAGIQTQSIHRLDPGLRQDDTIGRSGITDKELMPLIEKAFYEKNPRLWYSALMDYGAIAMKNVVNPNKKSKHYTTQSRFEGSRRYARAKILDFFLKQGEKSTIQALTRFCITDTFLQMYRDRKELEDILGDLSRDGFLVKDRNYWKIKN